MLLRADRTLGEHERADALSERLNSGEDVPTNAYVLFELIEYSRENWQERLATAHYMEGYSAALMMTIPDHARFSNYMRYGFGNLRQEVRDGEGVPVNTMVWPMYRYLNRNDGAGNGTAAVSSKQVGNVRK